MRFWGQADAGALVGLHGAGIMARRQRRVKAKKTPLAEVKHTSGELRRSHLALGKEVNPSLRVGGSAMTNGPTLCCLRAHANDGARFAHRRTPGAARQLPRPPAAEHVVVNALDGRQPTTPDAGQCRVHPLTRAARRRAEPATEQPAQPAGHVCASTVAHAPTTMPASITAWSTHQAVMLTWRALPPARRRFR